MKDQDLRLEISDSALLMFKGFIHDSFTNEHAQQCWTIEFPSMLMACSFTSLYDHEGYSIELYCQDAVMTSIRKPVVLMIIDGPPF